MIIKKCANVLQSPNLLITFQSVFWPTYFDQLGYIRQKELPCNINAILMMCPFWIKYPAIKVLSAQYRCNIFVACLLFLYSALNYSISCGLHLKCTICMQCDQGRYIQILCHGWNTNIMPGSIYKYLLCTRAIDMCHRLSIRMQ